MDLNICQQCPKEKAIPGTETHIKQGRYSLSAILCETHKKEQEKHMGTLSAEIPDNSVVETKVAENVTEQKASLN